jgi:hypothetical protein
MISPATGLSVVDGLELSAIYRELLRPGEPVVTDGGRVHRLPRFFYEIPSWSTAMATQLTHNFGLWEFMEVDLHEHDLLRSYPRYVPCAVMLLAAALEVIRVEIGAPMRIAANGGYRSPAHARTRSGSPHAWAAAANIYSIGNDYVDTEDKIMRYGTIAGRAVVGCSTRPFGAGPGFADDHLHVDIGYVTAVPRWLSES